MQLQDVPALPNNTFEVAKAVFPARSCIYRRENTSASFIGIMTLLSYFLIEGNLLNLHGDGCDLHRIMPKMLIIVGLGKSLKLPYTCPTAPGIWLGT